MTWETLFDRAPAATVAEIRDALARRREEDG